MPKLCILYVGIGRYIALWDDFYDTCERYFCPDIPKHYYIVTDSLRQMPANVTVLHQDDLGWLCNVLFRYMFFLRIKEQLRQYDYVFFFNGNTRFRTTVTKEDFLPTEQEGLVALTWKDGTEDADTDYNHERRDSSVAFIPYGVKDLYLQSGITGGRVEPYIRLLEECHAMTMKDFLNGIVPCSHDESIYNKYMLGMRCKMLSSEYGCPSQRDKNNTAKIIFLKKEKVLGRSYLRNFKKRPHTDTWLRRLLRKLTAFVGLAK